MTTLETGQQQSPPDLADRPATGGSEHRATRFSRWQASWRVALRMARRDLRRHRGRAALVFLMVAIPVGLLAGAATLGATEQTDPTEGKLQQSPDPSRGGMGWGSDNPPAAIPGLTAEATVAEQAAAVGRLVGG